MNFVVAACQIDRVSEAATKLVYLALRNIEKRWTMPARTWKEALNQFAVLFEDRLNAGPDCRRQHTMTSGTDPDLTQFIEYGLGWQPGRILDNNVLESRVIPRR